MKIKSFLSMNSLLLPVLLMSVFSINYSCTSTNTSQDPIISTKVSYKESGMDSLKLAEIAVAMQQFVNDKKISGAVTMVMRNGYIANFEAIGLLDIEKNIPMQKNTLFRIASMSKPFSAAAIMMLEEEGKLQLDDPVEKYLPEFRKMWLISEQNEEKTVLKQPNRPITVRDILAHIDGLDALPSDISVNSITENTLVVSQRPLLFEPGSEWRYGGAGINSAARIVEVLSGQPYEEFLKERVFIPLGMKNTSFSISDEVMAKLATLYQPSSDSGLEAIEAPDWFRFPRPDAGLISTATDMSVWMQTILNRGIYNGTRILTEKSVSEIIKTQTGDLKTGFTEGMSFGLAFGVVSNPSGVTAMLSKGTFGHGGAFGTQYWADPLTNTIYILMIQRRGFGNGDDSDVRKAFQYIASDAIIE
jgi:CubicO group peptidase (beta-lactamase class C family)